jgi:hypothetical protein
MSYVCLNCWQVYDNSIEKLKTTINSMHELQEIIFCPKTECSVGEVVSIDELYLPIIKLLNEKGYSTKYCCSGHVYNKIPDTYIVFKEDITDLPSIPEGSKVEIEDSIKIYYSYPEGLNEIDLYSYILDYASKVMKWAIELPIICTS